MSTSYPYQEPSQPEPTVPEERPVPSSSRITASYRVGTTGRQRESQAASLIILAREGLLILLLLLLIVLTIVDLVHVLRYTPRPTLSCMLIVTEQRVPYCIQPLETHVKGVSSSSGAVVLPRYTHPLGYSGPGNGVVK